MERLLTGAAAPRRVEFGLSNGVNRKN